MHRIYLLLAAALLAGACQEASADFRGNLVEDPFKPVLTGENWDGERFDLSQLEGKVVVIAFGYTFCPDVCPMTLSKLQQVFKRMGDRSNEVEVVWVSVDPNRDKLSKLADYVPNFNERFYGLRPSDQELKDLKKTFDVTVVYGPPQGEGTDAFYYVDHTGNYFLLDREGLLRVKLAPNATVEEIHADVEALLSR